MKTVGILFQTCLTLLLSLSIVLSLPAQWGQVGTDIDGIAGDRFGWSVSLSADGRVMASGASGNAIVRVYQDVGGNWVQLGADIVGKR